MTALDRSETADAGERLRLETRYLPAVIGGLLALLVSLTLDTLIHDLVFRYVVSHEVRMLSNGLTLLGTAWAAVGLLAGLAILGYRAADGELFRASLGGLVGIGFAGIAIEMVKIMACRGRPRLVDGWGVDVSGLMVSRSGGPAAAEFFHWPCWMDSRYQGFPSGHATMGFAVAAMLCRAAPTRRRLWLAIAGSIALSRIFLNAHFLSDVIGAGLFGWWAGRAGIRVVEHVVSLRRGPMIELVASSRMPPAGSPE